MVARDAATKASKSSKFGQKQQDRPQSCPTSISAALHRRSSEDVEPRFVSVGIHQDLKFPGGSPLIPEVTAFRLGKGARRSSMWGVDCFNHCSSVLKINKRDALGGDLTIMGWPPTSLLKQRNPSGTGNELQCQVHLHPDGIWRATALQSEHPVSPVISEGGYGFRHLNVAAQRRDSRTHSIQRMDVELDVCLDGNKTHRWYKSPSSYISQLK